MARLPSPAEMLATAEAALEGVAALPGTLLALNRSIRSLTEVIESARDTVLTMQSLGRRAEAILDAYEKPLADLVPGVERAAAVLNDARVDTVPEILDTLHDDVMPVLRNLRDTEVKIARIATSTERIMTLVDDAGGRLAMLPGASLLLGRRPGGRVVDPEAE